MIEHYLDSYGTEENYLRVYGGQVEFPEPTASETGELVIKFSRPIVFPESLIAPYNSEYVEQVPRLWPTEEELDQIKQDFQQF